MAATAPPYPRANQSEETVLWTWPMTRSGNQVRVLNPNTPRSLRRRTRQPAFLLVRVAVGLPGLEPGTSSLSATHREPLCAPPFPQVTSDRRGRSYRVYRPAVTRSPADGRLYCGLEPLLRGILEECWKPAFALPDPQADRPAAGPGALPALLQHRAGPHRQVDQRTNPAEVLEKAKLWHKQR
jgi:hypothetical protein